LRSVTTNHLEDTRTGIGGIISYDLSSQWRWTYSLNIDRYDNNQVQEFYLLYQNGLRFDYTLSPTATVALSYRNTHGYSPDPDYYNMNYDNNRFTIAITKQF
jgi:hypothetical protein